ncbi:MAG: carboxypeptidase regulatory-like domain-containing protein [Deltaproteobacteria bacterium]|nr:carboxypeptidase regulatory-like domain-containing protein [Deltaproteobacteria bacterium]
MDRAESRVPEPNRFSSNTGALAGTLRIGGHPPRPGVLRVHKERAFCGSAVPDQSLVVGPEGGLKNVVVTLSGTGLEGHARPPGAIQLDNIGCRFAPHVQAAQVGSTLLLLNSDPILHDAHARLGPRTVFNDGLPWWRRVKRTLDRPGLLKIICELHHAWMSAYIVVSSNPFFAVTDSRGRYVIEDIPPGTYEARFWHERLGEASRRVVVEAGEERRVDVRFPPQ